MIRAHIGQGNYKFVGFVETLGEEAIVRSQKNDTSKHALADRSVGHVCSNKTTIRSTKEEYWSSLLVYLELLTRLEDKLPIIVVKFLVLFNVGALSF